MLTRSSDRRPADVLLKLKLVFLGAAFVSFLFSVFLYFFADESQGVFVGLWVPSILALGALLLTGEGRER
ncbi:MAG: hypothetical protein ACXW2C_08345 [Acidimicrobiia bacterium]